jgi:hypothetical protein
MEEVNPNPYSRISNILISYMLKAVMSLLHIWKIMSSLPTVFSKASVFEGSPSSNHISEVCIIRNLE